ncbi:kinesin light chain [Ceratobasidium sp. AG-Ba]|nr:kinesin light chain [Ceratobasidium sp. AG-Ba]
MLARGPYPECEVSGMEPGEAMDLLLRTTRMVPEGMSPTDREAADVLFKSFGYLALAIMQAGAYIFCSQIAISQYRDMYVEHRQATLEKYNELLVKVDDYHRSVYTTWSMSYQLLSSQAQLLLQLVAFIHHTGIIEDIFQRAAQRIYTNEPTIPETEAESLARIFVASFLQPYVDSNGAWSSAAFFTSITELLSYSLISYDRASNAYTMHVLVHEWASTVIQCPFETALERAALLLAISIDYSDTTESLVYKHKIEAHVDMLLERHAIPTANMAARFGEVYYCSGKWDQMERMVDIALESRKQILGKEHNHTLICMSALSKAYRGQGRYIEAAILQEHVVEVRKLVSGNEHRWTLSAIKDLAQTYCGLGRYQAAASLQLDILMAARLTSGNEDSDTLSIMHDLAVTYKYQRRHDEAQALLLQVVYARKRLLGDQHPSTQAAIHVLASTYSYQGRYEAAESLQVDVLEVSKRRFGDEHPSTLAAMNSLANTYYAKGQYQAAEILQTKILDSRIKAYGEDHPQTLSSLNNLGNTYRQQGRYDRAEDVGKRAVDGYKRVLGTGHAHSILCMRNLLATYSQMGTGYQEKYRNLKMEIQEIDH